MFPAKATSLAFPVMASELTMLGWVLSEDTLTTCSPEAPAATKAKSPDTSTELAKPGTATKDTAVGEKLWTDPAVVPLCPWLVTVTVQVPFAAAKTFSSGAPRLRIERLLEE